MHSSFGHQMSAEKGGSPASGGSDGSESEHADVFFTDDAQERVFVGEKANNDTTTYQDADGAPVERDSPLGYRVGTWTALFLNVSLMIGTGIFSTRECLEPRGAYLRPSPPSRLKGFAHVL